MHIPFFLLTTIAIHDAHRTSHKTPESMRHSKQGANSKKKEEPIKKERHKQKTSKGFCKIKVSHKKYMDLGEKKQGESVIIKKKDGFNKHNLGW